MPNLKEINPWEGFFGWLKVTFVKQCEEEEKVKKMGQFSVTHILRTTEPISLDLVCRVAYIEGIKYMNLIESAQWL